MLLLRRYLFKRHHARLDEKEIFKTDISTDPGTREDTIKDSISKLLPTSSFLISSFRETAHYKHFFIFVPNNSSNATPWDGWVDLQEMEGVVAC